MFNFVSSVVDAVPGVGHVKGVLHYAVGDVDGGNKAMYQATRSSLVLAGGAVGAIGGPAGALAGASGAGFLTDTVCSVATKQPQGVVEGLSDVASDFLNGKLPIKSVIKTGLLAGSDMACGLGAGGISVGIKSVTKTTVKKVAEVSSKSLLVAGMSTQGILSAPSSGPHTTNSAARRSSSSYSSNSSKTNNNQSKNYRTSSTNTKSKGDNNKSSNDSTGSGSERPNNNRNDKNDHSAPNIERPEINLLRSMFNMVSLEEIALGRHSKQIFKNLTPGQIESLVSLVKTLQRNGRFEVIIRTIVYVCDNIDPVEVTFQNFLSISEFVNVYIEEQMKNFYNWSTKVKFQKTCFTPKQEVDEKLFVHCSQTIMKLINSLREKIADFPFTKYFRDIFSAFYHYYKHRTVPNTNREIEIDQYLKLIESMMEKVTKYPEYDELISRNHPRNILVFERFYSIVSRRARIVLKCYRGKVTLSSCFIRDEYFKDDKDGDEFIINDKNF